MIVINFTNYPFYPVAEDYETGGGVVTPLVKVVYQIEEDGTLTPLPFEEQPELSGDVAHEDDIGNSLKSSNDAVAWKPKADFIVNATCYPPAKQRGNRCRARISLDKKRKDVAVFGRRYWEIDQLGGWRISAPEPLEPTPIRWEYSFGGVSFEDNPFGLGADADPYSEPEDPVYSLPRIEDPRNLISKPTDCPVPAGFGPVAESLPRRAQKAGTQDYRWQLFEAPNPPRDFDSTYFNAAPDDQQFEDIAGYEMLSFENLHPEHAVFRVKLPDVRPRLFYVLDGDEERTLRDLPLKLDTVQADLNDGQVKLIWRGWLEHEFDELEKSLNYFHLVEEKASGPFQPASDYHPAFMEAIPSHEEAIKIDNLTPEDVEAEYFPQLMAQAVQALSDAGAPTEMIDRIKASSNSDELVKESQKIFDEQKQVVNDLVAEVKSKYDVS